MGGCIAGDVSTGPSGCAVVTIRKPMMGRYDETTRWLPGYRLNLLVDPCVIVLRYADGAVVAIMLLSPGT